MIEIPNNPNTKDYKADIAKQILGIFKDKNEAYLYKSPGLTAPLISTSRLQESSRRKATTARSTISLSLGKVFSVLL